VLLTHCNPLASFPVPAPPQSPVTSSSSRSPGVPQHPWQMRNTPARLANRAGTTRQKVSQLYQTSAHPAGSPRTSLSSHHFMALTPAHAGTRLSPIPTALSPHVPTARRHSPGIYLPTRQVIPNFPGECSSYFALVVYTRDLST